MIKDYSALQRKIVDTITQVLVICFAFIDIKFGGLIVIVNKILGDFNGMA